MSYNEMHVGARKSLLEASARTSDQRPFNLVLKTSFEACPHHTAKRLEASCQASHERSFIQVRSLNDLAIVHRRAEASKAARAQLSASHEDAPASE